MQNRKGVSLIWVTVSLVIFMAAASLAVDFGRVQLAKAELRRAADAAARAGASGLGSVAVVQARVAEYAALNNCDGTPIEVDANSDIEFGTWDYGKRTFTVLNGINRDNANAIRVTCRRTAARSNALSLLFAGYLGKSTCDVSAKATAAANAIGYGVVGLDYVSLKGNSTMSYWSATGTVGGNSGHVSSNGNITSTGTSHIDGTVWTLPGATVSGVSANSMKTLGAPLSYPPEDVSPYLTSNNNNQLGGQYKNGAMSYDLGSKSTKTIPGGVYVVNDWNVAAQASVSFTGPITIFYSGTSSMSGQATTNQSLPKNLKIVAFSRNGVPPGPVTIGSGNVLYANIYAPQANVILNGSGTIYGWIIGKSITMSGTSDVYYDLSSPGTSSIQLVQ